MRHEKNQKEWFYDEKMEGPSGHDAVHPDGMQWYGRGYRVGL
ncbi:hypothetical protein ACFPFV_06090 [Salinicoccus siamensis]